MVDSRNRLFGYQNLYVCDGSVIAANLGVNPSLTICALAERAMSQIPPAASAVWNEKPRGNRFLTVAALIGAVAALSSVLRGLEHRRLFLHNIRAEVEGGAGGEARREAAVF